ncbi:MAG: alpha/beta hydrolase family protein [Candidatus Berkiella sp.]
MLFRWLFGPLVSKLVMPSQNLPKGARPFSDLNRHIKNNHPGVFFNEGSLPTTDQRATINFSEFSRAPLRAPENQKIIINAVGNGDIYENHLYEYLKLTENFPQHRIVAFNFRGTLQSKGQAYSEDDWLNDVISIVKHYQNQGVALENILLHGHSMGGALVTMAAAKIYQDSLVQAKIAGKDLQTVSSVKVLNNRSFINATEFILRTMLQNRGAALLAGIIYGSLLGFALGISLFTTALLTATLLLSVSFVSNKVSFSLMRPLVKGLLWLTFGTLEAGQAYLSLPQNAVDHIVAKNDSMIKDEAGIHHLLRKNNAVNKERLRAIIAQNNDAQTKRSALSDLLNIKDAKVALCDSPNDGLRAHNESLQYLFTYHKARGHSGNRQINGQEVLQQKMSRLLKLNT